ncbi:MAG TPA: HemK/PrmC family methyltransferase [Candidatus Saccharimonadales bacterium]|jgi:release factor glutamine methyltransferase|nr:HemK/PrmC family methyltransferase [Candidatus Saccharimonadales bacterium]
MGTTVGEWLLSANALLTRVGIGTAHLDAVVLLEDCIKHDRAWILAHTEHPLSEEHLARLNEQLNRRAQHEPLSYIRNKTEFYGREFYIDHRVLEPRPESETMIDMLKSLHLPREITVIDVGTGSGALAITARLEVPRADVMATDLDPEALKVAEQNCEKHSCDIDFLKGNLLKPFYLHYHPRHSVVLANLPYVPDSFHINPAAMREPRAAIFGGPDGLDLYRELFEQVDPLPYKPLYILTEAMPPQHELLRSIASRHHYRQSAYDDFIQVFRPA